ncbi:SMP-30/gluconolactonase/LRE family protein [Kineococcus sp. NUM-3379]
MSGAAREVSTFATGGAFFESPRWHVGRLWVSDFWRRQVVALSPGGGSETAATVEGSPSGLGWAPDGDLLVVSMLGRTVLRVHGGEVTPHAQLPDVPGPQANDMVVDGSGGAYVGTVDFAGFAERPATCLVRIEPDGSASLAADGLSFPNGMVITADGATLVVAESWAQRLTAFDIGAGGALTGRRVWAELPEGCAPDGIALDAEGAVWLADAAGHRALRVREGGEVLEEVAVPGADVIACALGGPGGDALFLCTTPDFRLPPQDAARLLPAQVLTCRVDVPAAAGAGQTPEGVAS